MIRVKSAIFLAVLLALIGCGGAQLERPDERVLAPSKEEQEQRRRSVPTFTYRPGAGLMIEGR
jgi:predicted small lipoprotein YifL